MRTNLFTVNYAFNKSCCFWKKLLANVTMSAIRIKSQHCQLVSSGKQLRVEVSWNHSKRSHVSDHIAHGIFPFYFFFLLFLFFPSNWSSTPIFTSLQAFTDPTLYRVWATDLQRNKHLPHFPLLLLSLQKLGLSVMSTYGYTLHFEKLSVCGEKKLKCFLFYKNGRK